MLPVTYVGRKTEVCQGDLGNERIGLLNENLLWNMQAQNATYKFKVIKRLNQEIYVLPVSSMPE